MLGRKVRPAAKSPAKPAPPRLGPAAAAPKPYHHGDLRRVLIDAALELVGEGGPEAVSVREAARRAGVSPGAPFRHFPSRDALMQAVAEEAQRRFRAEIVAALAEAPRRRSAGALPQPGAGLSALGDAQPDPFRDHLQPPVFRPRQGGGHLPRQCRADRPDRAHARGRFCRGQLRSADLKQVQIAGRALVYGFARMKIDGHFPRWGVGGGEAERTAEAILDLFIEGIASG